MYVCVYLKKRGEKSLVIKNKKKRKNGIHTDIHTDK